MNYSIRIFCWIAIVVSITQFQMTLASNSYLTQIENIKNDDAIKKFMEKHEAFTSQWILGFKKLFLVFEHVNKTEKGSELMKHLWYETETVLQDQVAWELMDKILLAAKKMKSKQFSDNLVASINYFVRVLTQSDVFSLTIYASKLLLKLVLSKDGLKAVTNLETEYSKLIEDKQKKEAINTLIERLKGTGNNKRRLLSRFYRSLSKQSPRRT